MNTEDRKQALIREMSREIATLIKERDELQAEIGRLTVCLKKANDSAEKFEREWYLRGDELGALQARLDAMVPLTEWDIQVAHALKFRESGDETLDAFREGVRTCEKRHGIKALETS